METRSLNIIAIDPGASGGIATLIGDTVQCCKMPESPREISDLIDTAHSDSLINSTPIMCYMEKVGGYVGGIGQPASSMFTFGEGVGVIHGILTHARIPFELVTPQRWQKGLNLGTSGKVRGDYPVGLTPEQLTEAKRLRSRTNAEIGRAWKSKLKQVAERLFPYCKVTLATSDCLLILEYGRRSLGNTPTKPFEQPQAQLSI
jgi:hypothetical protein